MRKHAMRELETKSYKITEEAPNQTRARDAIGKKDNTKQLPCMHSACPRNREYIMDE